MNPSLRIGDLLWVQGVYSGDTDSFDHLGIMVKDLQRNFQYESTEAYELTLLSSSGTIARMFVSSLDITSGIHIKVLA